MISYSTDDAIFALATPWARSAIAVVRASGDGCISMLSKAVVSKKDITKLSSNTAHFCRLISPSDGLIVDEIVLTVYKDGHGYTGEEAFEISCHGGLQVIKAVLNTMAELGLRQAQPGEFTLRAFLHGKLDLTRAEAVEELIDSRGRKGQTMALNRLSGSLFKRISSIKNQVLDIMSIVEVQLDYAEDEVGEDLTFPVEKLDKAIKDISSIHDSYDTGRLYSQGAKIVLAGPSNAGKSSLFNLFLKEDRSIVSAQKGTTRDFIEALCTIGSIPVRLYDTAGFHDSSDSDIELEGIRRSKSLMDSADIIIYMVDATELGELDSNVVADPRCIAVLNKTDLTDSSLDGFIKLSVVNGQGFEQLCKEIEKKLTSDIKTSSDEDIVIENARQRENLFRAIQALKEARLALDNNLPLDIISMDIQEALEALGEMTGEVTTDDILDKIFGSFCVGK